MPKPGVFYKAVRDDLTSFHDPEFQYRVGGTHRPSTKNPGGGWDVCTEYVLHASPTPPQACRYARWPWRILKVTGKPVVESHDKSGFRQLKVIGEIDVAESFGPHGSSVLAVLRRAELLTADEARELAAARDLAAAWVAAVAAAGDAAGGAAGDAAWVAALAAAGAAAGDAAGDAAWVAAGAAALAAAWDAARAAASQHLIGQHGFTQQHFDILTGPWRSIIGPTWEQT
jgi:hypothetical protein